MYPESGKRYSKLILFYMRVQFHLEGIQVNLFRSDWVINNVEKSGRFSPSIYASTSLSIPHLVWQLGSSTCMQSDSLLEANRLVKNLPQSCSRERSSMTYVGFSEVSLKGHLKWTSYQISNLFKAHDSHLLFAPSFAANNKSCRMNFSVRSEGLCCARNPPRMKMECPWRGKMAKKVSKLVI